MVAAHELVERTLSVKQGQEVVVRRPNKIGLLFELSSLISDKGVNVLAVSGAVCGDDCVVRLVTDNNGKTRDVLAANDFTPEEENVVMVELPHRTGTLMRVTETLAQEDIDIRHIYAAAARDQDKCLVVLQTSDDEEALSKMRELQAALSEGTYTSAEGSANMVSEGDPII